MFVVGSIYLDVLDTSFITKYARIYMIYVDEFSNGQCAVTTKIVLIKTVLPFTPIILRL